LKHKLNKKYGSNYSDSSRGFKRVSRSNQGSESVLGDIGIT
jgi:hypothetical protein